MFASFAARLSLGGVEAMLVLTGAVLAVVVVVVVVPYVEPFVLDVVVAAVVLHPTRAIDAMRAPAASTLFNAVGFSIISSSFCSALSAPPLGESKLQA